MRSWILVVVLGALASSMIAPASSPAAERRIRVGAVQAAGAEVEFSGLRPRDLARTPRSHGQGALHSDGAGGFVWSGAIEAPGAKALRLHFAGFYLPQNARLTVRGADGGIAGPYTGRGIHGDGQFWSHTVSGSSATLHLEYAGSDTARALRAARFVVKEVGHLDRAPPFGPSGRTQASNLCGYNADCVEDAAAAQARMPAALQSARDGIALILFRSGPSLFVCSAGALADTDDTTDRPLLLTANHCVSRGREARSVEAFFRYSLDTGGTCSALPSSSVLGASILATGRTSDFTLLELKQALPAGTLQLGWTSAALANSHGVALYRISHPAGAPQAYSEHVVDTARATCSEWPRGAWIYSSDVFGGTEGGSSGSPVLLATGEVVGQLSGACGFNIDDDCDSTANATVDGALASYWTSVAAYLDPTPCSDADGDGSCAGDDCDDSDPAVHPGAAEVCDDGVDNDCDGQIDSDDSECGGSGGCDLEPVGSPCASDSQCCSNKCKGRPGGKTCK